MGMVEREPREALFKASTDDLIATVLASGSSDVTRQDALFALLERTFAKAWDEGYNSCYEDIEPISPFDLNPTRDNFTIDSQ